MSNEDDYQTIPAFVSRNLLRIGPELLKITPELLSEDDCADLLDYADLQTAMAKMMHKDAHETGDNRNFCGAIGCALAAVNALRAVLRMPEHASNITLANE